MKLDVSSLTSRQRIELPTHMMPLTGGKSYSAHANLMFPAHEVTEVSVMWFKKKLAFGSNKLLFRDITIEPLDAPNMFERRMNTRVLCGSTTPIAQKSEYPLVFNINCRPW